MPSDTSWRDEASSMIGSGIWVLGEDLEQFFHRTKSAIHTSGRTMHSRTPPFRPNFVLEAPLVSTEYAHGQGGGPPYAHILSSRKESP
jgi:hypothetical protein